MKSIMHNESDRTCYLCMFLNGDYDTREGLQEHHAIPGTANRKMSEHYGLKVYLCRQHHTDGPMAVHNNVDHMKLIQKKAQAAFEKTHSRKEWMEAFGKNYI